MSCHVSLVLRLFVHFALLSAMALFILVPNIDDSPTESMNHVCPSRSRMYMITYLQQLGLMHMVHTCCTGPDSMHPSHVPYVTVPMVLLYWN